MTRRSLSKKVININSRAKKYGCSNKISIDDIHKLLSKCKNQCVYCGSDEHLTIDHNRPLCRGGKNTPENLVVACSGCNSTKGDKTAEEFMNANARTR
jgi:5-methylcytosine-specific restriction endonuclease McrA